jgi:hypothetical protein
MGFLFFVMNIFPGFLLKKTPSKTNQDIVQLPLVGGHLSKTHVSQRAEDSRLVQSIRGSGAIDMVIPSTAEHKMYLAGIEEEDVDGDESRKY